MDRFWDKVDIRGPDECWPWTGSTNKGGYGRYDRTTAHRRAYKLTNGPTFLDVCHTCDNPPCCNPAHLFAGSELENAQDMKNKNRQSRGEARPDAKLNENTVRYVRLLAAAGVYQKEIADMLGVSKTIIGFAVIRRTWKHVL